MAAFWPALQAPAAQSPPLLPRLLTTFGVTGGTVAIALAVGIPAACALRARLTGTIMLVAAAAALSLPPVLHAAAWLALFPRGAANGSALACMLVQGLALAPVTALALALALSRIDLDLEDALRLELSGPRRLFWRLRHLYAGPFITAAAITAILAATTIAVTDLLLVRTLAEETFSRFQIDGHAATARLLLPLPLFAAAAAFFLTPNRTAGQAATDTAKTRSTVALWLLLPLLAAVAVPVAYLLRDAKGPLAALQQWPHFAPEALLSVGTATTAAIIGTILAWFIAWDGWRPGGIRRRLTVACLAALLVVPTAFLGIGLIRLFSRPGLYPVYDSPTILVAAQLCRILPLQALLLIPFVHRVPRDWLDTACLDATDSLANRLRLLTCPLAPAVAAVALLGFVMAIQELDASTLVAPPGTPPLIVRLFTMLHYGLYPDVAAMGLLVMALAAIPAAAAVSLLQRHGS